MSIPPGLLQAHAAKGKMNPQNPPVVQTKVDKAPAANKPQSASIQTDHNTRQEAGSISGKEGVLDLLTNPQAVKSGELVDQSGESTKPSEYAKPNSPAKPKVMTTTPKTAQKPTVSPVDIKSAGAFHRIVCPSDEVGGLEEAAAYINDKIREIRQGMKGKSPSNEELLVLTCLELYDSYKGLKDKESQRILEQEDAMNLIQKMIKETKAVL